MASASSSKKTNARNRQQPNVLVTGTPGTGKTTLATQLAARTGFEHINVAELVKSKGLHEGYDAQFDTLIMDEDKVCDELEILLGTGGKIVDHHSCDFFPERWFDVVAVLQTDNTVLFDRLTARGYAEVRGVRSRDTVVFDRCTCYNAAAQRMCLDVKGGNTLLG